MKSSEGFNLDFSHVQRERLRRAAVIPVRMRKLSKVVVTFEDGTTECFDPPVGAAFLRERYTYEQIEGSRHVVARLDVTEIFWAERTPVNGPAGTSQAIRREAT